MFENFHVQLLSTKFIKHAFIFVCWQSPVQLDDFDAYIKDMAKDSDYKFSLQFEVSCLFPPCQGCVGTVSLLSRQTFRRVLPPKQEA